MEIEKFMTLYKQNNPEDFFNWLSKGRVMEVRFLSDWQGNKFYRKITPLMSEQQKSVVKIKNAYNSALIQGIAIDLNVEYRMNSLYIKTYEQLKKILLLKIDNHPLTRLFNIFIGVNPKRKVWLKNSRGLLYEGYYGGIAGTSHIQTILCDIEHVGEREGNATESMLEECIQGAQYLVKLLELTDYYINISGNGTHLWIAMNPAIELPMPNFREITIKGKDTVKYNLKEEPINTWIKTYNKYIEKLDSELKKYNPKLKVDEGAKDIARIARPPGSWNVKKGKTKRAVGTVEKNNKINININKNFTSVKPLLNKKSREFKEIKIQSKNHRYNHLNINESPLYKLLVSQLLPSTLSRNHFLEQSFARLIRDNDIDMGLIDNLVSEIDYVQQKAVQVDPEYLDDEEPFNSETVNSYCYTCEIDFVYPVMENIKDIEEGYISQEHYNNLNSYSEKTIEAMAIKTTHPLNPKTYFELKSVIRNLVDAYDRSIVFFTLKKYLKNNWEYLDRNKIILQIMNKTRRQNQ